MKRTLASIGLLGLLGCPSEKAAPEATAAPKPAQSTAAVNAGDASVAKAPAGLEPVTPREDGFVQLGDLLLKLPEGFEIVQQTKSTVVLLHVSDLTVTLGVTRHVEPAKDAEIINAFLKGAQAQLEALNEAKVLRTTRRLPSSQHTLRGLSGRTVDNRGNPVKEGRDIWVLDTKKAIITVSFIYVEDAAQSKAAIEYVLAMLRDGVDALEAAHDE